MLVVSADNQLYALDGQSGRPIWRHAGFFEGTGLLGGPSPAVARTASWWCPIPRPRCSASGSTTAARCGATPSQRPRRTEALAQINDIDGYPVIEGDQVYVAGYGGQMAAIELRARRAGLGPGPRQHRSRPGSPATSSMC